MFLLFLIVAVTAQQKVFYNEENAEELFHNFIKEYNKEYENNEFSKRFEIFKENLKEINRLNSLDDAIYGITEFTDLTQEEFTNYYTGLRDLDSGLNNTNKCQIRNGGFTKFEAPETLDYRQTNAVTPVKNQGQCGTCWIFASIGAIEGSYAIKCNELLRFSEQQLMNCLKCSGGCYTGGFMVNALSELTTERGVVLESDYPYTQRDAPCTLDTSKIRVKVTGCINFHLKDENELKEFLFRHGPIAIAVNANTFQYYRGGIMRKKCCPISPLNHAVLLVGYGKENGEEYWIIKNSYSESFGEKGYIRMSLGENTCGLLNTHAASAIVA